MDKEEYITIDPRNFIRPPFIKCPKCHKNSFGILLIRTDRFWRRCKECLFPRPDEKIESFSLPPIKKKIIYLDQFAISNMMKVLNPEIKSHERNQVDNFWFELFKKLDLLCKLQLIICPYSDIHTDESIVTKHYKALKRMYELLSYGINFNNPEQIKKNQVFKHVLLWARGKRDKNVEIDIRDAIYQDVHVWQDRIFISMNSSYLYDFVEDIIEERNKKHEGLTRVFERWRKEGDKDFGYWYDDEWSSFGPIILEDYLRYLKDFSKVLYGDRSFLGSLCNPTFGTELIQVIEAALKKEGITEPEVRFKSYEYLASPSLRDLPFLNISSLLYASLARHAAKGGQKNPPNRGMDNDVQVISTLMPYCNAMLIDKQCHSLLNEVPLRDEIKYNTKIFSLNNKDELLEYLDEIEKQMSKEHFEKVKEVYGEDWLIPYTSLYEKTK